MDYKLSYIVVTRNRLPFLKILFSHLLSILLIDEEIVVVDGDSTDGAKEYLQQLFEQGKIHQFISEPDNNQAHGWNKALLMAKGTIVKKIIDDDVYDYTAIRNCANYMISNPQIDICISNCLSADLSIPGKIGESNRLNNYTKWNDGKSTCFTFSDVYMLIRKSSLSNLGLYDTQFTMIDWEYSLRSSYLKAKIAYYTGYNSLAVSTPGNVSSKTTTARLKSERVIGKYKYGYEGDRAEISFYSEIKIAIAVMFKKLTHKTGAKPADQLPNYDELSNIYNGFYNYLARYNDNPEVRFIT